MAAPITIVKTGVAGLQAYPYNSTSDATGLTVKVNGATATFTASNGIATISAPTIAGGERIEITTPSADILLPTSYPSVRVVS